MFLVSYTISNDCVVFAALRFGSVQKCVCFTFSADVGEVSWLLSITDPRFNYSWQIYRAIHNTCNVAIFAWFSILLKGLLNSPLVAKRCVAQRLCQTFFPLHIALFVPSSFHHGLSIAIVNYVLGFTPTLLCKLAHFYMTLAPTNKNINCNQLSFFFFL